MGIIVLTFLFLSCFCYPQNTGGNRAEEIRKLFLEPESEKTLVVAHRGDWRNAPENSILAIKMAIELGVHIVEIDLQLTKDGIPILMHDETIDRTTTGSGRVSEYNLVELKEFNLKNGLGLKTPFTIPTLEEVLIETNGDVMLNLDKCYDFYPRVHEILKKTNTQKQVIIKSWKSWELVKADIGKYLEEVIYMPIIDLRKKNAVSRLNEFNENFNPAAFELIFSSLDQVNQIRSQIGKLQGNRVWVNSLRKEICGGLDDYEALNRPDETWGELIGLGFNIIQTDRPDYLLKYIHSR